MSVCACVCNVTLNVNKGSLFPVPLILTENHIWEKLMLNNLKLSIVFSVFCGISCKCKTVGG